MPLWSLNFHQLDQVTHKDPPFLLDFSESSLFVQSLLREKSISSFSARLAMAGWYLLYCVNVI